MCEVKGWKDSAAWLLVFQLSHTSCVLVYDVSLFANVVGVQSGVLESRTTTIMAVAS